MTHTPEHARAIAAMPPDGCRNLSLCSYGEPEVGEHRNRAGFSAFEVTGEKAPTHAG